MTCAEPYNFSDIGISPGSCIDKRYIQKQFGIFLNIGKDKFQRSECLCAQSKDIGIFNTCLHACIYCYATRDQKIAIANYRNHSIDSSSLIGNYSLHYANNKKNSQSKLDL